MDNKNLISCYLFQMNEFDVVASPVNDLHYVNEWYKRCTELSDDDQPESDVTPITDEKKYFWEEIDMYDFLHDLEDGKEYKIKKYGYVVAIRREYADLIPAALEVFNSNGGKPYICLGLDW